jgi:hypothetical protein
VFSTTMPDPKVSEKLVMNETTLRSLSTTVKYVMSPESRPAVGADKAYPFE